VTRRVIFRPEAEAEALEAREWYERCRPGLGGEFVCELERVVREISGSPGTFAKVYGDVRRAILKRFPYGVYFRALSDEVLIVAVIHGRRHPRLWRRRRR
jgi:plasmid stabilization system protein ParE